MRNPLPVFPPLISGHRLDANVELVNWVRTRATDGRLGAGDLVWADDPGTLQFALVLEPETGRERCQEMLFTAMVAVGDSIGALGPPEIAVTYQWPSVILLNEARVGYADLEISESEQDGMPDWMILSLRLALRPKPGQPEPGSEANITTLWDEGCGGLTRTMLLESISRHIVNLIHSWSEDGFKSIHSQWWGRLSKAGLAEGAAPDVTDITLIGLDESGNALIKTGSSTNALAVTDALTQLRIARSTAR
jgi:biotin-(acetyl-CoA carboxylase) ligase